jgi:hypothetical protein
LFKHCYYCFVWWTVCNLSVCKKVNRQYKHNLSCTLHYHRRPYRRIKVHRPFTVASLECHNHHRWLCGRITVRRHFTVASLEMPQSSPTTLQTDYVHRHFTVASLEMPQSSPTTLRSDYSPSAFHSSLTGNATIITDDFVDGLSQSAFYRGWWKWHNHRRLCRWNPVHQHWSAVHDHWQVHRRTVRIPKGKALNASLIACRCRRNYRRTAKNMEGN